ncbi:MAG: BadF/BadG/BcrA/BcrD ATPase family protein [Candidatus Korobacteraceae bacterium]|jgi:bcr-type benzoyl-CoA reductase subunit D
MTTTAISSRARSVDGQITAGVDVGSSAVKIAVLLTSSDGDTEVLTLLTERIRRRELRKVVNDGYQAALCAASVSAEEVCYVASTGEGELVDFSRGHFYGMTTHARGAIFLMPEVRAVLDIGALHARAMRIDERSRVLGYRMTGQCASGSGQFLENVARYLGIALDDVGPLSCRAANPQVVSAATAQVILTEIGTDVSRFRNASAFASWLGLCPEKRVGGGKMLSCKTRKVKHRAAPGLLSHCRRRAPTTPLVARALVRLRDYAGVSHSLTGPVVVARSISNMQSEANPIGGSYALDS